MAFVRLANALLLPLQLSLLLCCSPTTANHYKPAEAPHPPPYQHLPPPPPPHHQHPPPPPPPPHHHHYHHHPPPPPPPPPHHYYHHPPPPSHPHHHHHHHPPSPAPVKPPSYPPIKPCSPPPAKPPSHAPLKPPSYLPPRKLVAVQGVVFCKSCKYRGIDTLMGAGPLAGAVVKLKCNNTKYGLVEQTSTDKNGYFFFMPQKLTTAAFHKCKVFLVSSPVRTCSKPTNLHGGASGASLIPAAKPPVKETPFKLFSVGPFAFEPHKKLPCYY